MLGFKKKRKKNELEMTFLQHLEELRWHLIRSLIYVVGFAVVAFVFHGFIFDIVLLAPKAPEFITNRLMCDFGKFIGIDTLCINTKQFDVININMAGQFSMHIMVSLTVGFIVAFPFVFREFWGFVLPAFHKKERRFARGAIFSSSFLFLLGVLFGYYLLTPLSVHFLGSYSVSDFVTNKINLSSYISTITSVVIASGVIFELPILIYFLSKANLVSPSFLKKYRKHSLIVILTLSAIITPPDVFSQVLVALPLLLLYELGISISKRVQKKDASLLV